MAFSVGRAPVASHLLCDRLDIGWHMLRLICPLGLRWSLAFIASSASSLILQTRGKFTLLFGCNLLLGALICREIWGLDIFAGISTSFYGFAHYPIPEGAR
jgi:hypothetical protein